MPIDSILVAIGVTCMFLVFAVILAWADRTTTAWTQSRQQDADRPGTSAASSRKKAA
jgi:hypothetical protein